MNTSSRRPGEAGPKPTEPPSDEHEGTGSPLERASAARVRMTLDLSREQHRFLRQFALDADSDASSVLRTLLTLLEEDPALVSRVLAQVTRRYVR